MSDLVLYNDELITFQNPEPLEYINSDSTIHVGKTTEATHFLDPLSAEYSHGTHGLRVYVPIASSENRKGPYGVSGNGYRTYGNNFLNLRYGDIFNMRYSVGTSGQYYDGNIHPYPPTGSVNFFSYALTDVFKLSAGNSAGTTGFGMTINDGFQYNVGLNFSAATASGETAGFTSFYGNTIGLSWVDQNTSAWSAKISNASAAFTLNSPNKTVSVFSANSTASKLIGSTKLSAIENYQNMRFTVYIMSDKYTDYLRNPYWTSPYGDFSYNYNSTIYHYDEPEFVRY